MTALRIGILDLYARSDSYLGDSSLRELAGTLESAGHEARVIRLVLDERHAGRTWQTELAALLAGAALDLVVLPRAWDEQLLETLRGLVGTEAKLVRLTSGVAAALDPHFDHVLDAPGLLLLTAGGQPSTATYQRTSARDLRQQTPRVSLALATSAVVVEGAAGRATLTGPAVGCPFLLDAGKNARFERLAMDPAKLQTRGCTFCLDNIGAYAALPEAQVVDAWMTQLRAHKQRDPGLREVLLTDERPHPHLPALLRRIDEERLGPVEIMWKSRVDWLLEFADSSIEEALVLAERSDSVLHLYLVGFESFDAMHLELFNKGVTVEENRLAIDKMRELGRRHPKRFEYLRLRAHGIVLFTPWTTPESLLENARVMREVRFDELRTEAVRTRLRLYPRTPLHALAEAEGLLADAFDAGEDRAVEQGYDASTPWRFADARTRTIFHLATGLSRRDRSQTDATVLERATRFVLRWTGIEAAPVAGALAALERVLADWNLPMGRAIDAAGAAALAFDVELEGIAAGLKRACLKEDVRQEDAADLAATYVAMGFCAETVGAYGHDEASGSHAPGVGFATVAVARDAATLAEVLLLQRAHLHGRSGVPLAAMGALMGYPACCVEAFQASADRGDNVENERAPFRRQPLEPLDPVLNRLSGLRFVSHHLCRPACPASAILAATLLERFESHAPFARPWVRARMQSSVLFLDYERMAELDGRWEGERFVVTRVEPHAWRELARLDVRAIELHDNGVRVHTADWAVHEVQARTPLLVTPGAALAPSVCRALSASAPAARPTRGASTGFSLPTAFRVGVRVGEFTIRAIETVGSARELDLSHAEQSLRVRVRAHEEGVPATIRRGRFALDIDGAEALDERARAAVRVLVGALR